MDDGIYRMEGIHIILKVGKKPRGKPYDTKRYKGMMDMFIYENIKNIKITEESSLFHYYKSAVQV